MTDWQDEAACTGYDEGDDIFFPTRSGNSDLAKQICAGCPVKAECLLYALVNQIEHGVWGGMNPADRRRYLYGQHRNLQPVHGTRGAFRIHERLGEHCAECDAAERRRWQRDNERRTDRLLRRRARLS